jgi:hypothetical protein
LGSGCWQSRLTSMTSILNGGLFSGLDYYKTDHEVLVTLPTYEQDNRR